MNLTGPQSMPQRDLAIIGGGIVGLATAMALTEEGRLSLAVLEAEDRLAAHQTGNNSGVIHSGLYYKPGSLKAKNCVEGRKALYRFCGENGTPHEACGKVVVAVEEGQRPALDELERRGRANGLEGLKRLTREELLVRFQKRAHNPLLVAADFDKVAPCVPWLGGKRLRLIFG